VGAVVARWSGLEARALREAKRMGVRDFAAHLGVTIATVSSWEKRGAQAQLRYETQQMLDTDLAMVDEDASRRFELILSELENASPPSGQSDLPIGAAEAWSIPDGAIGADHHQGLGARSAQRTGSLVAAMRTARGKLAFVAPRAAAERVRRFVESTARVYVVKGPPGCGKTTMVGHLAAELAGEVDSQVHAIESWPLGQLDLPQQVLRYASIPSGQDALLTLEQQAAGLGRNLLVVVDGISSREQIHEVGRQLDMILRQVTHARLRFVLVVRTPPDLGLTAHPVLAASVHEPDPRDAGVSYRVRPGNRNRLGRYGTPHASQVSLRLQTYHHRRCSNSRPFPSTWRCCLPQAGPRRTVLRARFTLSIIACRASFVGLVQTRLLPPKRYLTSPCAIRTPCCYPACRPEPHRPPSQVGLCRQTTCPRS
jgi:transcriptional regulator with XRE-family HTH domain